MSAASAPGPTSRPLREVSNAIHRREHLAISGAGEQTLLAGELLRVEVAVERMVSSAFDVVAIAQATGVRVVAGLDAYLALEDRPSLDHERRLADAAAVGVTASPGRGLEVADTAGVPEAVAWFLTQRHLSACVLLDGVDLGFASEPGHHELEERVRFAIVRNGLRDAAKVGRYRNTAALLAGTRAGLPPALLSGVGNIARVDVSAPDGAERRWWLRRHLDQFHGGDLLEGDAAEEVVDELVARTDGDSFAAVSSLPGFSRAASIPVNEVSALVDRWRFGPRPDHWGHIGGRLPAIRAALEDTVYGQPAAIDAVVQAVAAATLGLDLSGNPSGREGKPRAVLVFAGLPGTGKTELAKALAAAIFGDPEAYSRVDGAALADRHDGARLYGAPPGYVGYEEGGELTEAVLRRPASVVLIDEFNRAHPQLLERLMSIVSDGHIKDNHGRTVHFSECVVIFTTNLGSDAVMELLASEGGQPSYEDVQEVLDTAVRGWLASEPALLSRLESGIVGFDITRPEMLDAITAKVVRNATFRRGPALDLDLASAQAMVRAKSAVSGVQRGGAFDGRVAAGILESRFKRLAAWLAETNQGHATKVAVRFATNGVMHVAVDDCTEEEIR